MIEADVLSMGVRDRAPPRLTVTVALFDRGVAIRSALRDLAANGVAMDTAVVVAAHVQGRDATRLKSEELSLNLPAAVATNMIRLEGQRADQILDYVHAIARDAMAPESLRALSRRALYPDLALKTEIALRASDAPAADAATGASRALLRQGEQLSLHLNAGGFALVMPVGPGVDPALVCSILLHYATASVQTHQVRPYSPIGAVGPHRPAAISP